MKNADLRIVAVDVRTASFGFAVFEGPNRFLDWGIRSFRRGVNAAKIPAGEKFAWLLEYYKPNVLVLRIRPSDTSAPRRELRETLLHEAAKRGIRTRLISRRNVKNAFDGANKYAVAATIAQRFPKLAPVFPASHKLWVSEEYVLSVFDAAATGIAYFTGADPTPSS